MEFKLSKLIDRVISLIPGLITVLIYTVMVLIIKDFKLSILLLVGGLLMSLILTSMDFNFLPLRPLIAMYMIASIVSFFLIVVESDLQAFGLVGLIVISFFVLAFLLMMLVSMITPDRPVTYIVKVIVDWYGVILLFVFLFALYYYECDALIDGTVQQGEKLLSCCYFSCVTFTGLGYGDVVTKTEFRMVAAMESIIGYICMGGVAATIYSLIQFKLQSMHKARRLKLEEEQEDEKH